VIAPVVPELAEHTSTKAACDLLGWSRATHYRAQHPVAEPPAGQRPAPPNALSAAECERVLVELNSARFVDKSVGHCWATLLDEGTYLCSMSTMHRLLRRTGQAGERSKNRLLPIWRKLPRPPPAEQPSANRQTAPDSPHRPSSPDQVVPAHRW
jgi:putative transposase